MRKGLITHKYDILVVKDFSRFSRRNSRGLVELEDLRDAGGAYHFHRRRHRFSQ